MTRHLTAARRRAALALVANYLEHMADALEHIDEEMKWTDDNIWPTSTLGDGGSRSTGSTSSVERLVVDSRQRLRDAETEMWDNYDAIVSIAHSGSHLATATDARFVPGHDHRRCNNGANKALEGWMVWRYRESIIQPDGSVVMRDADCQKWPAANPVIEGMCDYCLQRCNDWRVENGYERIVRDAESRTYLVERNVEIGPNGRFRRAG